MNAIEFQENIITYYPDIYEGSYILFFSNLDFNFSVYFNEKKETWIGRPKFSDEALFRTLLLKELQKNNTYRSVEAKLRLDTRLSKILGYPYNNTPNDSVLKSFFKKLSIKKLKSIMRGLVAELRSRGRLRCRTLALDSTPIKAYYRPPTKKDKVAKDPDATWGYSKSKGGKFYGYKAQVMVDTETGLPIECIVTTANVSDQKMVRPFINLMNKIEVHPKYTILDKGYDSEDNHLEIRERGGAIALIAINRRKGKSKGDTKLIEKYTKKAFIQLTLGEALSYKLRKKIYRRVCEIMLNKRKYKLIFKKRGAVERYFASLKRQMHLEDHRMKGLKNIYKHVLLQCIAFLCLSIVCDNLGIPEACKSLSFFQN